MGKIRVFIAEDSLTVRRALADILNSDPELEVVGEAEDGKRAIELCQRLRPDVVTMDMMLPVLSGLAATEYIMAYCPTPILVVSSSTNRGELFKTYDALAAGAVDVCEKAVGLDGAWAQDFLARVKRISRIKVITHPRAKLQRAVPGPRAESPRSSQGLQCLALGASTGGPGAVLELLRGLPPDFPVPILLVIHMSPPFASALAEWLDQHSPLRVGYAREGEPMPPPGESGVFMAPPDRHLVVQRGRLWLSSDPERHSCRPSVDVLFESVAECFGERAIACLLTGMGRDGAAGLLAVRRAGGVTLAQDEASSVVFGMPREAIELGAASQVLPLSDMAPALRASTGMRAG